MVGAAVHDIHEPVLDDVGVIADLALGHGDIDVDATEVDFGDWGDEELYFMLAIWITILQGSGGDINLQQFRKQSTQSSDPPRMPQQSRS